MTTIITLTNGKRVANFSSPHPFTFTDGSVLPAVSNEYAEALKVTFKEREDKDTGDVELSFELSFNVMQEVATWHGMWEDGVVDIVFCPLPMITALKDMNYNIKNSPFRAVRIEDRIKKLLSIHKQCI
jgi:hypothetical protein